MATDIVKLYISLLSEFFSLSDMAVATSPGGNTTMVEPSFLPPGTNSLSTSFYLARILQEITECINDIGATEMSTEAGAGLKELLDAARGRFEDALGYTWLRGQSVLLVGTTSILMNAFLDARLFHHLENWEPNPQVPGTTLYLTKMHAFHKHNSTAAYKIAGGVDPTASSSTKPAKQKAIGPEYASKISKAFLDALYAFLDGLVHLASDDWHASDINVSSIEAIREPNSNVGANVVIGAPALDLKSTVSSLEC